MPKVSKMIKKSPPKTIKKSPPKTIKRKKMAFENLPSNLQQKIIYHVIETLKVNYRGLPKPNEAMRKVKNNTNMAMLPSNHELNQILMNPNMYFN